MNQVYFLSIYIMDSKSVGKKSWKKFYQDTYKLLKKLRSKVKQSLNLNINKLTGFSAAFVTYLMILWWKILKEEFRDHLELELRIRGTGGMNGKQVVWVITRNLEPYQIVISSFPHRVILRFDLTLRTVT